MRLTSIDCTAYPRFKRVVSVRELAEAFTPTVEEAAWARGKTQRDQLLLAPVVQPQQLARWRATLLDWEIEHDSSDYVVIVDR